MNSHSKLSIVNDLLDRLDERSVRDEIVKSLLNSNLPALEQHAAAASSVTEPAITAPRRPRNVENNDYSENEIYPLVSPFDAMAAAVTSTAKPENGIQACRTLSFQGKLGQGSSAGLIDARVENYFCASTRRST